MGKAKAKGKGYEILAGRLWPNTPSGNRMDIKVFGVTGEHNSGKTLMGLSVAPGVHPDGHEFAGQPRTLYFDFEQSGATFVGSGAHRISVPDALGKEYTPKNAFAWLLKYCGGLKPAQYDVIMIDPITDTEVGLVDYIKASPSAFGLTPNQIIKAEGLLWGAVNTFWKQVLLKISAKCQTFFYTAHLGDEWKGNKPTSKRKPKGKHVLPEVSALYIWLERKPDADGNMAKRPEGFTAYPWGKDRVADTWVDENGEMRIEPLLPPHFAVCTIGEIRRYIANPPNYDRLRIGEKVPMTPFSEEEKLRLEVAKAEAEQVTEQSRLERLTRMAELQAAQQAGQTVAPPAVAEAAKEPAPEVEKAEVEKAEAEHPSERPAEQPTTSADLMKQAFEPPALGKASKAQQAELHRLFDVTDINEDTQAALLGRVNAATVEDLSKEHACLLIEKLVARAGKMQAEAAKGEAAGN